jgi:hypothetical protein
MVQEMHFVNEQLCRVIETIACENIGVLSCITSLATGTYRLHLIKVTLAVKRDCASLSALAALKKKYHFQGMRGLDAWFVF